MGGGHPIWEELFSTRSWGKYPPEELIRFIATNYYNRPDRKEVRILEVGCGTAANGWYIAREGFAFTGLDGSPSAIKQAQRRFEEENLTATFLVGNATKLAELFDPESFDAVIDVECLAANTMADVRSIVSGMRRVLKPGGKIFSKLVARGTYGEGTGEQVEPGTWDNISNGPAANNGTIHFFSLAELQELFSLFSNLEIEYIIRSLNRRENEFKEWIVQGGF